MIWRLLATRARLGLGSHPPSMWTKPLRHPGVEGEDFSTGVRSITGASFNEAVPVAPLVGFGPSSE
jgi:hypothetical protein